MSLQHKHIYDRPSESKAELAAMSSRLLAACSGSGDTAQLRLIDHDTDIELSKLFPEFLYCSAS